MSKYKYVTPHWEDFQDNIIDVEMNKKYEQYTMTHLSILNYHATETIISLHFYDEFGIEFTDMAVNDLALPAHTVWNPRVYDIIVKENKSYATLKHGRKGWLKITGSDQLAISGRIVSSRKPFNNELTEFAYSIPFIESPIEAGGTVYEPIDPGNFEPIGNKRPHFPRPFPR